MKEGILHGETLGAEDGRKFGLRTGEDFGSEIGMLKGHCIAWKHLISLDPTFCSDRAIKAIDALEELVNDFPRMNSPESDFKKSLNLCRAKFKVVKSLLKPTITSSSRADSEPPTSIEKPDLSF
mmetsp:Transcript_18686/g.24321  ORF Transcript_18686/g.24321 Transcript_18686/m.24321 type:complete len:124 (-) Transcript_18686:438-809(-)